jgi:hypothetical protein
MLELTHRRTVRWQLLLLLFSLIAVTASTVGTGPAVGQGASKEPPSGGAPQAEWKTSPFHGVIGGDGNVIPCRCLYRGMAYKLGERVCMNTHLGTVMTECDLQQNNTSWIPTNEACTTS